MIPGAAALEKRQFCRSCVASLQPTYSRRYQLSSAGSEVPKLWSAMALAVTPYFTANVSNDSLSPTLCGGTRLPGGCPFGTNRDGRFSNGIGCSKSVHPIKRPGRMNRTHQD